MKAVLLDADTLGQDIDLGPLKAAVNHLEIHGNTTPEQLAGRLAGMDIALTNKVPIPGSAMAGLKAICVMATGMNNVDLAAAERLGIPVRNVVNYGTHSVAQHSLMLMLALAARLPLYQCDLSAGAWQQSPFFCLMGHATTELHGKTLVLVGAGTLGSSVARLAEAFGMEVVFAARPGSKDDPRPSLEALLPKADLLSFHCPLTEHTHHLLNAERLALVKPGCLVVNCARGGIIDEAACLAALEAGRLGGLAVDVLPQEPPRAGHPLLDALAKPLNLIVTPHNAWISREARQKIVELTADNISALA
ncbi:D-2-hydroxyacid dehydrogenase [Gallaecimonas kandeliae]|uniref:D-2-hydroxyacid dehydrogenase n=1 Tax=Gallaecimonas kandeliae TaxID=3029055 RepID=UPI00264739F8|nr:D-2-hydroxyacid dehydrogenase [Gallaecimonas kandeliae]WKE67144.1 D-2-hydroxyacid dehydrogenase [Gallaecimonas kandeliae]